MGMPALMPTVRRAQQEAGWCGNRRRRTFASPLDPFATNATRAPHALEAPVASGSYSLRDRFRGPPYHPAVGRCRGPSPPRVRGYADAPIRLRSPRLADRGLPPALGPAKTEVAAERERPPRARSGTWGSSSRGALGRTDDEVATRVAYPQDCASVLSRGRYALACLRSVSASSCSQRCRRRAMERARLSSSSAGIPHSTGRRRRRTSAVICSTSGGSGGAGGGPTTSRIPHSHCEDGASVVGCR